MARTPQDVTEAELAVLQVLWEHGPATRRQITDILYPDGGAAGYPTVQKLLERLEAKGYARERRSGNTLTFVATIDRDALISRRLQAVADSLCEGSLTPLLTSLIRAQTLKREELQELQTMLDRWRREGKSPGSRR